VSPFAAAGLASYLINRAYIGAVRDSTTNWWSGWACGLPGQASCLAIPAAG
jgi:hypothetical protein